MFCIETPSLRKPRLGTQRSGHKRRTAPLTGCVFSIDHIKLSVIVHGNQSIKLGLLRGLLGAGDPFENGMWLPIR